MTQPAQTNTTAQDTSGTKNEKAPTYYAARDIVHEAEYIPAGSEIKDLPKDTIELLKKNGDITTAKPAGKAKKS